MGNPRFSGALVELPVQAWRAPLTALACIACLVVFGRLNLTGDPESWEHLARFGVLPGEAIRDGAYWALFTSAFTHVDPLHLVFNLYWLWRFGRALERELPWWSYATLLVLSAIVSSAAELAVSGQTGIGISGVVYALFGALWNAKARVPRFAELLDKATVRWLVLWLVGCFVATWAGVWNVANAAHVAGLLFGAGAAQACARARTSRAAGVGTLLFALATLMLAFYSPWNAD